MTRLQVLIYLGILISPLPACSQDAGEHVGSRDCTVIGGAMAANDKTAGQRLQELCETCQDTPCGGQTEASVEGCGFFPCVDGVTIVQGCAEDGDCVEFGGMPCGLYSSIHKYMCGGDAGDL